MSSQKLAKSMTRQLNAVVVSSGLMEKTVRVRVGSQSWHSHIQKHFNLPRHLLVHDPRSSLRAGDIVSISTGFRAAKHVKHVVKSIIAPFGEPIESRPPIPTWEELVSEKEEKKSRRAEGRRARRKEERKAAREESKEEVLEG